MSEKQKYSEHRLGIFYIICRWHNGLDWIDIDNMVDCCPYYEAGRDGGCAYNLATHNPPNMTPQECLRHEVRYALIKHQYELAKKEKKLREKYEL